MREKTRFLIVKKTVWAFEHLAWLIVTILIALFVFSCVSVPYYDEQSYQQASRLKQQALELMDKAVSSYDDNIQAVEELREGIQYAHYHAMSIPNNGLASQQWSIMRDIDQSPMEEFLRMWKERDSLSLTYIEKAKEPMTDAFNAIIEFEASKHRRTYNEPIL